MTKTEYKTFIQTVKDHSGAAFVQLRLDHVRLLNGNGNAAVVLAYILNVLRMKDANTQDRETLIKNELFIRCPAKNIQRDVGMKRVKQSGAIHALEKRGIIETKKGAGNILWIKILTKNLKGISRKHKTQNLGNLHSECMKPTFQKVQNLHSETRKNGCKSNNGKALHRTKKVPNNLSKNPREQSEAGTFDHNARSFEERMAVLLFQGLKRSGKLTEIRSLPPEWISRAKKFFRVMSEAMGTEEAEKEIELYIEDHVTNIRDQFQPKLYSMNSFCNGFDKVKDARERRERDRNKRRDKWEYRPGDENDRSSPHYVMKY